MLLAGISLHGNAQTATLEVSAKVSAALPSSPAVITSIVDQQHVSSSALTVAGTCPTASYVKLIQNGQPAGVSQCTSGIFGIQTSLAPGPNTLQVQVYNLTDDPGPASGVVTIYYDVTTVQPQTPPSVPTSLSVVSVDGAQYNLGTIASQFPTFSGFAPPSSIVTVVIHSDPFTCRTKASSYGWWSCTFDQQIPEGEHSVEITAVTPDGVILHFPTFHIWVERARAPVIVATQGSKTANPLTLLVDYHFEAHYPGQPWDWNASINGGVAPYEVTVDWRDGAVAAIRRDDGKLFTLNHTFAGEGNYEPLVRVTDSKGAVATFQLSAVVRATPGVSGGTTSGSTPFDWLRRYAWVAWPAYGVLLLMSVSFWLGEHEIVRQLRVRHAARHHRLRHTR